MKKPPLTNAEKAARKRLRQAQRYGLTVQQLDCLERFPVCAICHRPPPPGKHLYTDHDHKTGRVRGRLCWTCNRRLLGRGLENPARHRAAAEYLESTWDARKDL